MKIYIVTDLEGVAGVVSWDTHRDSPDDIENREWMTLEIQSAIEGAKEAGANEIIVAESHRLIVDKLDKDVKLVLSGRFPPSYLSGLDNSVDGVFIIGQHARAGVEKGVLNHTGNMAVFNTYLNGKVVGEAGFIMAYAGSFNIPVILFSGDEEAVKEVKSLVNNIETVAVKDGVSKYTAISLHPQRARELIKQSAKKSIKRIRQIKPFVLKPPYEYIQEFTTTITVSKMCLIPGVKRINDRTISYTSNNFQNIVNILILRGMLYDAE